MRVSDLARPPIQPHEIAKPNRIEHLICPYHDGPITTRGNMTKADEGTVFYCPIGRMFYRYTAKWQGGFNTPLPYNHERPV